MSLALAVSTMDDLRAHVLQTLCSRDQADPLQSPLHEAVITRAGRPCGMYFQTRGPRTARTHAIWAAEEDRLLFYDSRGIRFSETHLSEAPAVPAQVASAMT
jgi:hypothetical protein